MRKTGILMPVSALPSSTGVGELGPAAWHWIQVMEENGVKIWQILPLNPLGYGNSPYQPYSSCAGDELYISLELLKEEGFLEEEIPAFRSRAKSVDYEAVRRFKTQYLRKAYRVFSEKNGQEKESYQEFVSQKWVYEYSVFRALKNANEGKCWNEWSQEAKSWPENRTSLSQEVEAEASYQMFLQYVFYTQWMQVKTLANEKGIEIMGDVPFYVGVDSVDV